MKDSTERLVMEHYEVLDTACMTLHCGTLCCAVCVCSTEQCAGAVVPV